MKKKVCILLFLFSMLFCLPNDLPTELPKELSGKNKSNKYSNLCFGSMIVVGNCFSGKGIDTTNDYCNNFLKLCFGLCTKAELSPMICFGI